MVKFRIPLLKISAVAASKSVVIDCPVGPRYHGIIIQHGYASGTNTVAATMTNISEIRVLLNNRIQRRFSGTQLRDLNLLNGTAYDCNGVPNTAPGVGIPLFFNEPWRSVAAERDSLAWGTKGADSFEVQLDLGAASTPTIAAYAIVDDSAAASNGIVKVEPQTLTPGSTAFDDYIETKDTDYLQQLSLYPDSGASAAATKVILKAGNRTVHEMASLANTELLLTNQMTPAATGRTASIYDIVLDHDDLLSSSLPLRGLGKLPIHVEAGSAMSGTLTAIVQTLGPAN